MFHLRDWKEAVKYKENNHWGQIEGNGEMVEKSHGEIDTCQNRQRVIVLLKSTSNQPHAGEQEILWDDFRNRKSGKKYLKAAK